MLKNKDKVFALIFLILGAVLYFIPNHIASVCPAMPDGGFMKCHWTGEVVKALGVLIVIIAAVMLFNGSWACYSQYSYRSIYHVDSSSYNRNLS